MMKNDRFANDTLSFDFIRYELTEKEISEISLVSLIRRYMVMESEDRFMVYGIDFNTFTRPIKIFS